MIENATLVKFSEYKYLRQLKVEGLIYMNNLPFIRKIEDKMLRGDMFDSVTEIHRGKTGTLTPNNKPENIFQFGNWVLGIDRSPPEKVNIFCMCSVRPSKGIFPIDDRNFSFGDYALIFTKPQEFIDRISRYLQSQNVSHKASLIDYFEENYTGEVGFFKKRIHFQYQHEWRLVCKNGPGKARIFHIGSIKDICIIVKNTEVNQRLSKILNVTLP